MESINRREMLKTAAAAAAVACLCELGEPAESLGQPAPPPPAPPHPGDLLDAGPIENYAAEGITGTWARTRRVILVRHGPRLYALTARCTHRGCVVRPGPDHNGFVCPCHHAAYGIEGRVVKPPAKLALDHLAIHVDDQKHVIVNPARHFPEGQWDDPASFIPF